MHIHRLVEDAVVLREVCAHVVDLTCVLLKPGVEIVFEISETNPPPQTIRGDPERLKQVWDNVCMYVCMYICMYVEILRD